MKSKIPKPFPYVQLLVPIIMFLSACSDLKQGDKDLSSQPEALAASSSLQKDPQGSGGSGKKCKKKNRPYLSTVNNAGETSQYSREVFDGKTCEEQMQSCIDKAIANNSQLGSQATERRFFCTDPKFGPDQAFVGKTEEIHCKSGGFPKFEEDSCAPKTGKVIRGLVSINENKSRTGGDRCHFEDFSLYANGKWQDYYKNFDWNSSVITVWGGCDLKATVIVE